MAVRLRVDTSFLIDLYRERSSQDPSGPGHRLLRNDEAAELFLSAVALGEFAEEFSSDTDPALEAVRRAHTLLPVDEETAMLYGRVARWLRSHGQLIGTNDLWIGCTSLQHGLPLVTANVDQFRRIQGLIVIDYRGHA